MDEYLEKGKDVMKSLLDSGQEAFFIGPAVRDFIMNNPPASVPGDELEIITSAREPELRAIFPRTSLTGLDACHFLLREQNRLYRITTYAPAALQPQKESAREKTKVIISAGFERELASRACTIDCLCMDYLGKVIDLYGGFSDIQQKALVTVRDPRELFAEDPLQAIHVATLIATLGFRPARSITHAARREARRTKTLSPSALIPEMHRILISPFASLALQFLVTTGIARHLSFIGPEIKRAYDNTAPLSPDGFLIRASVKEGSLVASWRGLADDAEAVESIVREALRNPHTSYDAVTLFKVGLPVALASASANADVTGERNRTRALRSLYKKLPIKAYADLALSEEEIRAIIAQSARPLSFVSLRESLALDVLSGTLPNDREALRKALVGAIETSSGTSIAWDAIGRDESRSEHVPFAAFAARDDRLPQGTNANANVRKSANAGADSTADVNANATADALASAVSPAAPVLASPEEKDRESVTLTRPEREERISRVADGILTNMATSGITIDDETRAKARAFAHDIIMKEEGEEQE